MNGFQTYPSDLLKYLTLLALVGAATSLPATARTVLFEDFESPDVPAGLSSSTDEVGPLPDNANWVGSAQGYGAAMRGIIDKASGNFSAPDPNSQAFALRYTNASLTSAEGAIGPLSHEVTYTISFDVVRDGSGEDTVRYQIQLLVFEPDDDRTDGRAQQRPGTVLLEKNGSAPADGSWATVEFSYTPEPDDKSLGKDLALRFLASGPNRMALLDNLRVTITTGKPASEQKSYAVKFP